MAGHVDFETYLETAERSRRMGIASPAMAFLWVKAPVQAFDQWGQPLPLSPMQQDGLDRMFAIIADPVGRGEALLHSGQLADDEVQALVMVYPDVYAAMVDEASREMLATPLPYPAWVEAQLGVLFQKPASAVYSKQESAPKAPPANGTLGLTEGTQADRRELAVRAR
jgi:hypothetical protein